MCRFHKSVSFEAATDPVTGKIHRGHEALLRCAFSNYWLQRYMPEASGIGGYSALQMATPEAQALFARSGLAKPPEQIDTEKREGIAYLRQRLADLEKMHDLSPAGLNIPHGLNAMALDAFLEKAVEDIFYVGDPGTDRFVLADDIAEEEFKPLFRALQAFTDDERTRATVRTLLEGSIASLFSQAPDISNAFLRAAYNGLPQRAQKGVDATLDTMRRFKDGFAAGGVTALAGHSLHYGLMGAAALGGAAASAFSVGVSAIAVGALYEGWRSLAGGKYLPRQDHIKFIALNVGFSMAAGTSLAMAFPHDHAGHDFDLTSRPQAEVQAAAWGMSLDSYLRSQCITDEQYETIAASWDKDPLTPGLQ